MSDEAQPTPVAPVWPMAWGEHPDLPQLRCALYEAVVEDRRVRRPARPAYARVHISPVAVLETGNPDRLREWSAELADLADALEWAHGQTEAAIGQQTIGDVLDGP